MKLLIITQSVDENDQALGFFCSWIEEFALRYSHIEVICLSSGEYHLPENVRVHSLGKKAGSRRRTYHFFRRLEYSMRFIKLIWQLRREYDEVFVHMNPEYVLLGGVLWRLENKTIALWYVHKSVTLVLRAAAKLADVIFTANRESFRLSSPKVRVIGHGIDLTPAVRSAGPGGEMRIITVGRFSASKGQYEALAALDALTKRGVRFSYTIVGAPVTAADEQYAAQVRQAVEQRAYADSVRFLGKQPHTKISSFLAEADVFLHLSDTGSLDKVVLESLISGVPVVTSNEASKAIVPHEWYVPRGDAERIASSMVLASKSDVSKQLGGIAQKYSLPTLIDKMVYIMKKKRPSRARRALLRALLFIRDILHPLLRFQEVSILCYHSISNVDLDTAIAPGIFEQHLKMLKKSGAVFVSLGEIMLWRDNGASLPRRAVAITFDDGYKDFISEAVPILALYKAPAALFAVGDFEAARSRLGNNVPLLTQDNIGSILDHKTVEIGYHSKTHANMSLLDGEALADECEPRFHARFFAYPGGNYGDAAIAAVQIAGYDAAFSIKRNLVTAESNRWLLPRSVILSDMSLNDVRAHTTRAIVWYRWFRSLFLRQV